MIYNISYFELKNTHCSFLKYLFSTPVWFSCKILGGLKGTYKAANTFIRSTAIALSAGVRNQAFVGESGNRSLEKDVNRDAGQNVEIHYQNASEVKRVRVPVIIISLNKNCHLNPYDRQTPLVTTAKVQKPLC